MKSARGISVEMARVDRFGPQGDRRYMLVGPDGDFVTQRRVPALAHLVVTPTNQGLALEFQGQTHRVRTPLASAPRRAVTIWGESVQAVAVDSTTSSWLSGLLSIDAALVYMPDDVRRSVDPRFATDSDTVGFADGFSFLLIGQSSLDALNARLDHPVGMDRFRPNLVIADSAPFAEDGWSRIAIGDLVFDVVKPCARCVMTTVDPSTGRFAGPEPLKTMASFRRIRAPHSNEVYFGQNLVHRSSGVLKVGDRVRVLA